VVADVGAGKGQLTLALAGAVGSAGHVFSSEIDPARLRALREAVAEARLGNVTVVEAKSSESGLPAGCCDAIVLRRVYHHLTDPVATIASLPRALRPGGLLAVIDIPPLFFLPDRSNLGITPQIVINEVTEAVSRSFSCRRTGRVGDLSPTTVCSSKNLGGVKSRSPHRNKASGDCVSRGHTWPLPQSRYGQEPPTKSSAPGQSRRAANIVWKNRSETRREIDAWVSERAHAASTKWQTYASAGALPQTADMSGDTGTVAVCVRAKFGFCMRRHAQGGRRKCPGGGCGLTGGGLGREALGAPWTGSTFTRERGRGATPLHCFRPDCAIVFRALGLEARGARTG